MARYPKSVPNLLNRVWLSKESASTSTGEDAANDARSVKQLVDEAVFREIDQWGTRSNVKQGAMLELELLVVFLDYFASLGENNQLKRNTVFVTLFPPVRSDRLQLLSKLVCMAMLKRNAAVLNAAAVWMQELGCTSEFSAKLADDIYLDLFLLVPEPLQCLNDLPTLSPHFTANLVTTFAERFVTGDGEKFDSPPDDLLAMITLWMSKNRTLCMAALVINIPLLLPRGTNLRPATSPFGGLIRWCVLAPLYTAKIFCNVSKVKEKNMNFSKLHLSLVQSAEEGYSHQHLIPIKYVVSVQQLATTVESICMWAKKFKQIEATLEPSNKIRGDKALTCALDQLAQVVHLLLAANRVSGNLEELISKMKLLPPNRFLDIVLDQVTGYKVPVFNV